MRKTIGVFDNVQMRMP